MNIDVAFEVILEDGPGEEDEDEPGVEILEKASFAADWMLSRR